MIPSRMLSNDIKFPLEAIQSPPPPHRIGIDDP